jgi:hypothetical protein
MPHCNHEEADTRIVVHVRHALQQGMRCIEVRTVDTDVVVILVAVFYTFNLWLTSGLHLELPVFKHQCYNVTAQDTSFSSISCSNRLRHNLSLQRQGQEICLASLAGI